MSKNENWLPVVGFEGFYEVSDVGRVRSVTRSVSRGTSRNGTQLREGKVLSANVSAKGYARVELSKDGQKSKHHVHVLMLEAFVGPRPAGHEGAHNDGNSLNNELKNLSWKTSFENNADRKLHGTLPVGERHPQAQIDEVMAAEIKSRLRSGEKVLRIAASLGLSKHIIFNIKYGKTWAHVA